MCVCVSISISPNTVPPKNKDIMGPSYSNQTVDVFTEN